MSEGTNHEGYRKESREEIVSKIKELGRFTRNDIHKSLEKNWTTITNVVNDLEDEGNIKIIAQIGDRLKYKWIGENDG